MKFGWRRGAKIIAVLVVLVAAAGQFGAFSGQAPDDLGVRDGRLKAPSTTPNSVSSQADLWPANPQHLDAQIAPLPMVGDAAATLARLAAVIESMPGAKIVTRRPDYLYVQFTTRLMHFVDDAEFWVDPQAGVVQVRSASRVGRGDLGVNRERIEAIRARMAA